MNVWLNIFIFYFCRNGSQPLLSESPWRAWTPLEMRCLEMHKCWSLTSLLSQTYQWEPGTTNSKQSPQTSTNSEKLILKTCARMYKQSNFSWFFFYLFYCCFVVKKTKYQWEWIMVSCVNFANVLFKSSGVVIHSWNVELNDPFCWVSEWKVTGVRPESIRKNRYQEIQPRKKCVWLCRLEIAWKRKLSPVKYYQD